MTCLPCEKEIIDGGMGTEAARLYREVSTGTALHVAAANFYIRVEENIFSPFAKRLLGSDEGTATASKSSAPAYKLSADQHDRLMSQIDKQCYRADELLAWAVTPPADPLATAKSILAWVKDDQSFYTELLVEFGPKE